jgi:phasin protein
MSKRKPTTAPKHARRPKIAAKAQRATQAIVRSPKVRLRSVAADSAESSPKPRNDSEPVAPLAIPMAPPPVAPLVIENPVTALQEDFKKTMTVNSLSKGFDLSSATASVRAYQAKLLEMAQANMTFAFEFSQRLATIKSPPEFLNVIAEFTSKRIAMFRKHSTEMAELSTKRWTS